MKIVDFNENALRYDEISKVVRKVRAFVINSQLDKVLLVYYAGLYMLPGGSIDNEETELEALKRELLEEAGIEIDDNKAMPFLLINSYDKDYVDRKCGIINRLTKTYFYKVVTNQNIDNSKKKLSESELKANQTIEYIDLNNIKELIEMNESNNKKRKQFDREILTALYVFSKIENFCDDYTLESRFCNSKVLKK